MHARAHDAFCRHRQALIRDCVVDPPSFMHSTVQKINKEVHVLRKQVNAIEARRIASCRDCR